MYKKLKKPIVWSDLMSQHLDEHQKLKSLNYSEKLELFCQMRKIKDEQTLSLSGEELTLALKKLILLKHRQEIQENANIEILILPFLSHALSFITVNSAKRIAEFCFSSSFSVNPDNLPLGISFIVRDEEWEGYLIKCRQDWYQNKPLNRWTHLTIFIGTYCFVFMEFYCKNKLGNLQNRLNPLHKPRLPRK